MTKRYLVSFIWLAAGVASPAVAQPVGPEFQINTYTTDDQEAPSVASDASGNFVVVWQSYQDGGNQPSGAFGVFGQRFDSGGSRLGGEFRVNTYTTDVQRNPSVASDADGNFVVVWESDGQDGMDRGVFGQRYDDGGHRLGGEFQVNTYTRYDQGNPAVASDAKGNFVVVWNRLYLLRYDLGIFGQRYDAGGNRLGSEFQVSLDQSGYTFGIHPTVASDPRGNFVVVWRSGPTKVHGRRYDSNGNPLDGEFEVNTQFDGSGPSVASDSRGNFVVAWTGLTEGYFDFDIFGRRYDSDGHPLDDQFQVNTYTTDYQTNPSIASDASGNFVVVWTDAGYYHDPGQDGSGAGVFGQRYDSDGNREGDEFQINTYTTDRQSGASVSSNESGDFVVVWIGSNDQDGSGYGIFGQRFSTGVSNGCRSAVRNPTSLCPANPQ